MGEKPIVIFLFDPLAPFSVFNRIYCFFFLFQTFAIFLFIVCGFNFFIEHYFRNFVKYNLSEINENPV
jgi:hypothetical protein